MCKGTEDGACSRSARLREAQGGLPPTPPTLPPLLTALHPSAARGIVAQRGAAGLYRGLGVTVLEIMPYAALQFGLYDLFNAAFSRARVSSGGRAWR